jgi:hypothetical protein
MNPTTIIPMMLMMPMFPPRKSSAQTERDRAAAGHKC